MLPDLGRQQQQQQQQTTNNNNNNNNNKDLEVGIDQLYTFKVVCLFVMFVFSCGRQDLELQRHTNTTDVFPDPDLMKQSETSK